MAARVFRTLVSPTAILGLLGLIILFNILGIVLGWYLTVPLYDKVHHFGGGGWIALLFFYLLQEKKFGSSLRSSPLAAFIGAMALAALAGVAWELFEASLSIVFPSRDFFFWNIYGLIDTLGDLVVDIIGAAFAAFLLVPGFCTTRSHQ